MHMASVAGKLTTMAKLVQAGANVRATDRKGCTCLTYSVFLDTPMLL